MTPPRGPHKERTEHTTAALVAAARELFAADGYAATSLDAITAAAGVTKGALYHHFPAGKKAVFRAVYDAEQAALARAEAEAFAAADTAWSGFHAGCEAFLRAMVDPGVGRIVLLDAPGALGEEPFRDAQADSVAMLASGLRGAMKTGVMPRRDETMLAHLLHGALCRAASVVARSDDPDTALRDALHEVHTLLDGLV